MAKVYQSLTDYINDVIVPALKDEVDNFDVDKIASDMLEWQDEYDNEGKILLEKSGLIEKTGADFWTIVSVNEK